MNPETNNPENLKPQWKEKIEEGILGALDSFEIFDSLINISPGAISDNTDERDYQELSPQEQEYIKKTLFNALEVNPDSDPAIRTYRFSAPEPHDSSKYHQEWSGVAEVRVFRTSRSDEGLFLHVIHHPDGKVEYAVAEQDRDL